MVRAALWRHLTKFLIHLHFRSTKKRRAPPPPLALISPIKEEKSPAKKSLVEDELNSEKDANSISGTETVPDPPMETDSTYRMEVDSRAEVSPTSGLVADPKVETSTLDESLNTPTSAQTDTLTAVRETSSTDSLPTYAQLVQDDPDLRVDFSVTTGENVCSTIRPEKKDKDTTVDASTQDVIGIDTAAAGEENSNPAETNTREEEEGHEERKKKKNKDRDDNKDEAKPKTKKKHKKKDRKKDRETTMTATSQDPTEKNARIKVEDIPNFRMIKAADVHQVSSGARPTPLKADEAESDPNNEDLVDDYMLFEMDAVVGPATATTPHTDEAVETGHQPRKKKKKKDKKEGREKEVREKKITEAKMQQPTTTTATVGETSLQTSDQGERLLSLQDEPEKETLPVSAATTEDLSQSIYLSDEGEESLSKDERPKILQTTTGENRQEEKLEAEKNGTGETSTHGPESRTESLEEKREKRRRQKEEEKREREAEIKEMLAKDLRARANRRASHGGDLLVAKRQTEDLRYLACVI